MKILRSILTIIEFIILIVGAIAIFGGPIYLLVTSLVMDSLPKWFAMTNCIIALFSCLFYILAIFRHSDNKK